MKKHFYLIIIILFSLLALAVICFMYWQANKDSELSNWQNFLIRKEKPRPIVYEQLKTDLDTSDWIEYKDKNYGISFKYPKDWEVKKGLADLSLGPKSCSNLVEKGFEHIKKTSIFFDFIGYVTEKNIGQFWNVEEKNGIIVNEYRGIQIIGNDKDTGIKKEFISISEIGLKTNNLYIQTSGDCLGVLDVSAEMHIMEAIVSTLKFYK